ncbi:ArnT family glycosyltransferase [Marinobacter pelagius]|uniref:Dolichyl-phosphate-mannose-protein mannosyltransferase n=1 Tax=Marinobacter pelagius TaxID=379482 RepID=A0A1I4R1P3_9GAMM|nr:glycosyltransferase family 39 protein [Marinobacter pelagius]SFM46198.1 Dolichyl-phosphate-mannose-protein mannosyltransferase [Marinobacter pelagius]
MTKHINTLLWLLVSVLAIRLGLAAILPLADTTEPRYAEIARIMTETGDWITPWFDYGVPFWGKPPLSFWTQALSFKVFGVSEFAGRLPSWLANCVIVFLIYTLRRYLHTERTSDAARASGLWAALIYATTALGFLTAGTVMTDSFLALGSTLVLTSLVIRLQGGPMIWGWMFFIGLAIGLLAKGPLILVLTGLPVFLWVVFARRWQRLWECLPWLRGSALTLAIAVPWYVLAELKTPGFFDYFIVGEHIKRFLVSSWQGDLYGNAHEFPRGTIWLHLVLASFPWGLIAIAAFAIKCWRSQETKDQWHSGERGIGGLILASALSPAIFFTLSGNILWTYVLPGLPFLAVLAASLVPRDVGNTLRPSAVTAVLLIPFLGTLAAGWLSLNPETLKTERDLVARVNELPGMTPNDLLYLDKAPFSARFYTQGRVRAVEADTISRQLAQGTLSQPALLAVEKGNKSMLNKLQGVFDQVDQNRRYQVFLLEPSTGSPEQIESRESKKAGIEYTATEGHPLT